MPKYYCDYCDTFLTHDSPSVRKTHCTGRKHKDNVKFYYQKWIEDQAQSLIDATTSAFQAGKMAANNPFASNAPWPPGGAAIPPPPNFQAFHPPRGQPPHMPGMPPGIPQCMPYSRPPMGGPMPMMGPMPPGMRPPMGHMGMMPMGPMQMRPPMMVGQPPPPQMNHP